MAESNYPVCKNCKGLLGEVSVNPECHPGWLCKSCWNQHRCNILTDSKGSIVNVGDNMRHIGDERIYVVTEIVPTFTKGQTCVGEKILKRGTDGGRHVLRTRLMEIAE